MFTEEKYLPFNPISFSDSKAMIRICLQIYL